MVATERSTERLVIGMIALPSLPYQVTSHDQAYAQMGVQGTGLQTGVPAACGAIMIARGQVPGKGVFAPEQIDPEPFLELMTEHGAPWGVVDLPPEDELPI